MKILYKFIDDTIAINYDWITHTMKKSDENKVKLTDAKDEIDVRTDLSRRHRYLSEVANFQRTKPDPNTCLKCWKVCKSKQEYLFTRINAWTPQDEVHSFKKKGSI